MKKYYTTAVKIALVLVYLVIIAGALVRMTGSGMGCPDWPKCFGYYIPPTDIKQLLFTQNHYYETNQVIIKDEKLWVAIHNFKSETLFEEGDWRPYTKHDYAIFNATETWIEYINRLIGALAGIAVFIMAIFSIWQWKNNKQLTVLSWITVLLMGIQGWLGAKVVYSVLNPIKITIHTVVALLIVAVLLYLIKISKENFTLKKYDQRFKNILIITIFLTFIQIILGTQVRQFVDEQTKLLGENQMGMVLQNPMITFYIHRSFSLLILSLNIYLFLRNRKLNLGFQKINWVFACIGLEIFSGVIIYYLDFPFGSQAIHLIIATLIFGLQFYLFLENNSYKKTLNVKINH
jgi:heme a synthase